MNNFQTIVLGIFAFFIIAGLLAVALVKQNQGRNLVSISIWGTIERNAVEEVIRLSFPDPETLKVFYSEIPENSFDRDLIEALAVDRGPDMILLPLPFLARHKNKLNGIPYSVYTERAFKDAFIQEGDLFLFPTGIAALPFSLDPLVMYFNRDLLDEAGISVAPKFWDEFLALGRDFTRRDDSGNITRSAVALGEYRNINHAREILAALFLQGGNPITETGPSGTLVTLKGSAMTRVLDFYTEFANPQKPVYSWNRSFQSSKEEFLAARLAIYFGFGSEYKELLRGNPNLNFDVASFPRPRDASVGITYGKLTGISILRTSPHQEVALQVALTLSSPKVGSVFHSKTGLPPVQRGLLADKPTDAYGAVMYDSAIRARGFRDPDPKVSAAVFKNMIESVTSGRERSGEALRNAQTGLQEAFR